MEQKIIRNQVDRGFLRSDIGSAIEIDEISDVKQSELKQEFEELFPDKKFDGIKGHDPLCPARRMFLLYIPKPESEQKQQNGIFDSKTPIYDGFRDNKFTIAEKFADVLHRNEGAENIRIEPHPTMNETLIEFVHHYWSMDRLQGLFSYCEIQMKDWLKNWSCSTHEIELPFPKRTITEFGKEFSQEDQEKWDFYPKKYVKFHDNTGEMCPNYPEEECLECETCSKNIAIIPTLNVKIWIKPDIKDCIHEFNYSNQWDMEICHKCGFMKHSEKKGQ